MAQSFLERLKQPPVLCDGAMGTELYARLGVPMDTCLDQLNLTNPDAVREIHLGYIRAGAEVLESNTFGANRVRLGSHGLQDAVEEINHRGVAIALEARRLTGQMVWVGGAMGPLGRPLAPLGSISLGQAREAFREQAAALSEAGADLIILETFGDLEELREAVKGVREASALPIIAQMTVMEEGWTVGGASPAEVASALEELEGGCHWSELQRGLPAHPGGSPGDDEGDPCSSGCPAQRRLPELRCRTLRLPLIRRVYGGAGPAHGGGGGGGHRRLLRHYAWSM